MKLTPVESSMIYAVGYDGETRELEIFYHSGRVYRYEEVGEKVYKGLLEAKSKGKYMNTEIIGVFDNYKVTR